MLFTNNTINQTTQNNLYKQNIGTEEILQKQSVKFLCVVIDDKLTWQPHIERMKNKSPEQHTHLKW